MKHPSQEDLLGYVLGALDAQEERDLQEQIDANPEIEDQLLELRQTMSPLDSLTFGEPGNRPGLARRTCELVASLKHNKQDLFEDSDAIKEMFGASDPDAIKEMFDDSPATSDTELQPSSFSRLTDRLVHPNSWSRVDVLAGVAILAIFASVLFPAISHSRFHGRINSCKHNLTQVGNAMLAYSDLNSKNFINISGVGLASSNNGLFAPVLRDRGFIDSDSLLPVRDEQRVNRYGFQRFNRFVPPKARSLIFFVVAWVAISVTLLASLTEMNILHRETMDHRTQ